MEAQPTALWKENTPPQFWLVQADFSDELWCKAYEAASQELGLSQAADIQEILALTLGEGRFGPGHWNLSLAKRIYYLVKPALPRKFTRLLRRLYSHSGGSQTGSDWPIDSRYVKFLWGVLAYLIENYCPGHKLAIQSLWPGGHRYAFVLTHDIETREGQAFTRQVADLEESLGFHSLFNFVPERYRVDLDLVDELRHRGFEVGLHGLKHDGKLFSSRAEFYRRATKINRYLGELGFSGFRAPLTHRNPAWMQALEIEYDLSFFDTDPFEPIPGGSMSIWPFFIGHFVELPYTLLQDYTLISVLGETSPRIWLEKVDFIEKYHGMALINTHPDYLKESVNWDVYSVFLQEMKDRSSYWHANPIAIARWWRERSDLAKNKEANKGGISTAMLADGVVKIEPDTSGN